MAGYLPDEANAEAFVDGWYRTGDVGWLEPEGWVHLTDRSKEMIKVNGFQVAPAEIEAVLHGHPAVLDCAVFGVARRAGRRGAGGRRAARPRPAGRRRASSQQLVADSLATYKQLRQVVVVDAIPRLPSGKVLRRTLRDEWAPQLLASGSGQLMDVRLSPEQQALRDSAAQVVDRLGPHDGRRSSTTPSGPPSSTPPSPRRAGASCASRPTATQPLASGVEVAIVAEELGRGLADAPFLGPTLAAELRRLAGAPPATTAETVALTADLVAPWPWRPTAPVRRGRWPSTPAARRRPSCSLADGDGHATGHGRRSPPRPSRSTSPGRRAVAGAGDGRRRRPTRPGRSTDDDLARVDGARPGARPAPTSSAPCGARSTLAGDYAADAAPVRRGRSARSRPCSTCWPTPSSPPRARAASPSTPPGRSTRSPADEALAAAAVAKAYCARAARTVCETAIQVHGGIGNTWECLAHVYLRRALLSSDVLGGVGASLARVLAHHGIGGDRWTSVTRPRRPRSGRGSAPGCGTTTPACRRRRPTTTTGRGQAAWHQALYDAGFFGLSWPTAIGGHGLPSVYDVILDDELAAAGAPPRPSLGYLVQGILEHGSDDIQQRFLPGIVNGRDRWCQGFSEPDAGSDLASLRTRAERDGDEYVITGHKVWTSYSDVADWCLRAGPHRPRRPQAQGHLGLRRADAPARHRAAAAADDQRHHQGVRRGALRRRPRAGRRT